VNGNFKDLTGQIFGCLKVLKRSLKTNKHNHIFYDCVCIYTKKPKTVEASKLRNRVKSCGDTKDCGYAFNVKSISNTINATIHGLNGTIEYQSLHSMILRVDDLDNPNYKNRKDFNGNPDPVLLYKPWREDPQVFYDYCHSGQMPETLAQFEARCPGKTPTIDRIDNTGHYVPGNIQWATQQEQAQNRSSNVINPDMVKFIVTESVVNNKSGVQIFELLKTNYNYQGSINPVYNIINSKTWTNIKV